MTAKSSGSDTTRDATPTKPFAWQGIGLEIPRDWDLGALDGDAEKGFARIDDAAVARIELRWMPAPRGFDIQASTDRYLAGIEKAGRKQQPPITTKRRTNLGPDVRGVERRGFVWEGPCRALGCLVRHENAPRAIAVQVLLRNDERRLESLARDVLRSVHDQVGRAYYQWALYDFVCEVDARMKLATHRLQSGAFRLEFDGPLGVLTLSRYALANVLLRGRTPAEWYYAQQSRRERRRYRDQQTACDKHGHAACLLERRRAHWWLRMPPKDVVVWECPESNQLLCAECAPRSKRWADELLARAWDVLCHG